MSSAVCKQCVMPHNKLMHVHICSHRLLQVHLTSKDKIFKDSSYDVYTKGYPATGFVNFQDALSAVPSFRSVGSGRFYDATSQNGSFMDSMSNVRTRSHCIHPRCTPPAAVQAHLACMHTGPCAHLQPHIPADTTRVNQWRGWSRCQQQRARASGLGAHGEHPPSYHRCWPP